MGSNICFNSKPKHTHFKHGKQTKKNMSAMVKNSKKEEEGGRRKGWEEGGKMKVADY